MKYFPFFILVFFVSYVSAQQADSAKAPYTKDSTKSVHKLAFIKVEIESEFPGGQKAWVNFLGSNLVYPSKAVKKKIEGTLVIQFIVDSTGAVTYVEAVAGPEELREAGEKLIKKSPRWKPAMQSGKAVNSYKKQPIVYSLH